MTGKDFEILISRLYKLLEPDGVNIIWNDYVLDIDNPRQLRQIDITIKRSKSLTRIECRYHKSPQDVKWIEELYGKKIGLGISHLIAVSGSGFTEGARLKAKRFDIELKELKDIKEDDILTWKDQAKCMLFLYELRKLNINFHLVNSTSNYSLDSLEKDINTNKEFYNLIIDDFFHGLHSSKLVFNEVNSISKIINKKGNARFFTEDLKYITIETEFVPIIKEIEINNLSKYSEPNLESSIAYVEDIDCWGLIIRVIKNKEKSAVYFDYSNLIFPENIKMTGRVIFKIGKTSRLLAGIYNEPKGYYGKTNISCIKHNLIYN